MSGLTSEGVLMEFVDVSKEFEKLNFSSKGYWSRGTFCRLFAPILLKQHKKIFYFYCDMIIRCDLQDLYKTQLQNNVLAGVKDVFFNKED